MKELDLYYDALFSEARKLDQIKKVFLGGVLICLSYAIYATGYFLYSTAITAGLLQLFAWYLGYKVRQSNLLGHEFQKHSMLEKAYGLGPSEFDLSHLKGRVSICVSQQVLKNFVKKQSPIEYKIKDDSSKEKILRSMLQENAYWNHHLYQYTFQRNMIALISIFICVLIVSLFMVPLITSDPDYSLPRLTFTVLSFSIVYEIMEVTLNFRRSARDMLELDNELSRLGGDDRPDTMLRIFTKYNMAKILCPSIPKKIYLKNRDRLNDGWMSRICTDSSQGRSA